MSTSGSSERLRLLRDIGRAEKSLDRAMALLDRTQRAMVEAGSGIMQLHALLHEMRNQLEPPHSAGRERKPDAAGSR